MGGSYRLWLFLCLGWVVSSADRTVTGPVVTWMIQTHAGFMATADPYTTGGLVGSIFFAGYMLTQFPGGFAGDRFGYRSVIVISLAWAALATLASGLVGTLAAFIAARIATGLGEGAYYANDRSIIAETTPTNRVSLAMGVVITGLSMGITLATIGGAWLVALGETVLGAADAWRMPFFVLAAVTAAATWAIRSALPRSPRRKERPWRALGLLLRYAIPCFALVFGAFLLARWAGWPGWALTLMELAIALALIALVARSPVGAAMQDRDLVLLYVSFVPILWHLWFLGFWAVAIVAGSAGGSLTRAAATAMFTGLSGLIGYPLGGWLADRALRTRAGRKGVLLAATAALAVLTLALAAYLDAGGSAPLLLAALLFTGGLFFNALQPVSHAMVAELAPAGQRGSAFGAYNLIGEIGAVLSPIVSGMLRDATGGWTAAIYLDAALVLGSLACVALVRARPAVLAPAG